MSGRDASNAVEVPPLPISIGMGGFRNPFNADNRRQQTLRMDPTSKSATVNEHVSARKSWPSPAAPQGVSSARNWESTTHRNHSTALHSSLTSETVASPNVRLTRLNLSAVNGSGDGDQSSTLGSVSYRRSSKPTSDMYGPISSRTPRCGALDPVLQFEGYFVDKLSRDSDVTGLNIDFRVRRVVVTHWPLDHTTEIRERKDVNSGLDQGLILKRRVVEGVERYQCFNVGATVCIYGREYHLVDATSFSRKWLQENGVDVPPRQEVPSDPFLNRRCKLDTKVGVSARREKFDDSFLRMKEWNDRRVHWRGTWKETLSVDGSKYGQYRKVVVSYYPATFALELHMWDADEEKWKTIMSKRPAVKSSSRFSELVADVTARTDLNRNEFLGPHDMVPGTVVDILSRKIRIDGIADDESKTTLEEKFNVKYGCNVVNETDHLSDASTGVVKEPQNSSRQFLDIDAKSSVDSLTELSLTSVPLRSGRRRRFGGSTPRSSLDSIRVPPHTGMAVGSDEDTRQNCLFIHPKPPRRSFQGLFTYGDKCLRAQCQLLPAAPSASPKSPESHRVRRTMANSARDGPARPDSALRRRGFVLNFYLADGTIAVYETTRVDGGFGGRFSSRRVQKNPATGLPYTADDIHEGSEIVINGCHVFKVMALDDYTSKFATGNADKCDSGSFSPRKVMELESTLQEKLYEKKADILAIFRYIDADRSGKISSSELKKVIEQVGGQLSDAEMRFLFDRHDLNHDGEIDYYEFLQWVSPAFGGQTRGQPIRKVHV